MRGQKKILIPFVVLVVVVFIGIKFFKKSPPTDKTFSDTTLPKIVNNIVTDPVPSKIPAKSNFISTKFFVGDRVKTIETSRVRAIPSSGTLLGKQPIAVLGNVIEGPIFAGGFWWWKVNYDNNPDGWSVENFLTKVVSPLPPSPSLSSLPSSRPTPSLSPTLSLSPPPPPSSSPSPPTSCTPGACRYLDMIYAQSQINLSVATYRTVSDQYGTFTLQMNIYRPPAGPSPDPVMILMHGGNFVSGNKSNMDPYGYEYARRGYLAVSINYRLLAKNFPAFKEEAAHEDALGAIAYLKSQTTKLNLNPNLILIGGWSAGSITAYNVGYNYENEGGTVSPVKAVMGLDGREQNCPSYIASDPPFFLAKNSQPSADDPGDVMYNAWIACINSLGLTKEVYVVPGTTHSTLVQQPYAGQIATRAAPFFYNNVLVK